MSNLANQTSGQTDAVILARLDERTRAMSDQLGDVKKGQADMSARMDKLTNEVDQKLANHGENYVTRAEFSLVQAIVYGGCGLVLLGVVGALIALVVRGGPIIGGTP